MQRLSPWLSPCRHGVQDGKFEEKMPMLGYNI